MERLTAGWHPDTKNPDILRYFDGEEWTDRTQPAVVPKPGRMLPWAVLATVFCAAPFGLIAVWYAWNVETLWARGEFHEARRRAAASRRWVIASIATGVVTVIVVANLRARGAL